MLEDIKNSEENDDVSSSDYSDYESEIKSKANKKIKGNMSVNKQVISKNLLIKWLYNPKIRFVVNLFIIIITIIWMID